MIANISPAAQDYLKVIYVLTEESGRATTSQIADYLEVKPASVTGMLQKMANEELKHKEKMEYLYSNTAFTQTSGG